MTLFKTFSSILAVSVMLGWSAIAGWAADPTAASTVPPTVTASVDPALQKQIDAFQTKSAAATNARSFSDYKKVLDQFATPDCTFVNDRGETISLANYLLTLQRSLAGRAPGLTETIVTVATTVTGDTAIETGTATDAEDAVDAQGQFGPKGQSHHLESQTSFRTHWAKVAAIWKIQIIAFTGTQLFVDGNPYVPPAPRNTPRSNSAGSKSSSKRGKRG